MSITEFKEQLSRRVAAEKLGHETIVRLAEAHHREKDTSKTQKPPSNATPKIVDYEAQVDIVNPQSN